MNSTGVCTVCMERCSKENMGCQCVRCMRVYHIQCGQVSVTISKEQAKKWICQNCSIQKNLKKLLESQEETIKRIPEMVAKEVRANINLLENKMNDIELTVNEVKNENCFLRSMDCRRDLIITGLPGSIRNPKELRDIVIKIGSIYNIAMSPGDIFQCLPLRRGSKVLVKFGNLFIKEDLMKLYLSSKDLKLNQILSTDVESRVYLNNNYPSIIQKTLLYCRRLKKLKMIEDFKINFTSGKTSVTGNDKLIEDFMNFGDLHLKYKLSKVSNSTIS